MTRPNIVYLHTHDAGRAIEPYGFKCRTPNLQRLAEEGVMFRKAFAAAPTCSPSRAALVTGKYPHNNGMFGLSHREAAGFSLRDYGEHLQNRLKGEGYTTALAGIQHIDGPDSEAWEDLERGRRSYGRRIGYDRILNLDDMDGRFRQATMAAERAAEFVAHVPDQPFFLSVGLMYPHMPFKDFPADGEVINPNYVQVPATIPDTPEVRQDLAVYTSKIQHTDQKFGLVLDAVDSAGLADNTIIICTTDHGVELPGMKCCLSDAGTGVFLIMRGPGIGTGTVVDKMVTHLDIFPTLCDMLQMEPPADLQGRSLVPVLEGGESVLHDYIFSEVNYHAAYQPMRAIRGDRWKYIRRFYNYDKPVFPNQGDTRTKALLQPILAGVSEPREELYDLLLDPAEQNNMAGCPETADIEKDMADRLRSWMKATGDPLLDGPITMPEDGLIASMSAANKREQRHTGAEWNELVRKEWRGWQE